MKKALLTISLLLALTLVAGCSSDDETVDGDRDSDSFENELEAEAETEFEFADGDAGCIESDGDAELDIESAGELELFEQDIDYGEAEPLECPPDSGMVPIENRFCMDRFEASRADATDMYSGYDDDSAPRSVSGVIPWTRISRADAILACEKAGKRLCSPEEWGAVCGGPSNSIYCYGEEYEAATCNGIDAFCDEPYYKCAFEEDQYGVWHMSLTGAFADCTNAYGIYDINGNVWEWDTHQEGHSRGGAYNCSDSMMLHRCDYVRSGYISAASNVGFRCCWDKGDKK